MFMHIVYLSSIKMSAGIALLMKSIVISSILFFCVIVFLPKAVYSEDNRFNGQTYLAKKIDYIFINYKSILNRYNWRVSIEKHRLRAFRLSNGYTELNVTINSEFKDTFLLFKVLLEINSGQIYREFRFNKNTYSNLKIKNTILPFLIEHIGAEKGSETKISNIYKRIYFPSFSIGYNRTHDNMEFYPEYKEGSLYLSWGLLYDPVNNIEEKDLKLTIGDYFLFNIDLAYNSEIRENSINVDMLIYGRNRVDFDKNDKTRLVHGFFNGFEYFRPGFLNTTLLWKHPVYKEQPHIQYLIWRAIQWGYNRTQRNDYIYNISFMIGCGPSMNSSLNATNITETDEKDLSDIFMSNRHRKENYYYSLVLPISLSFTIDRINNFRIMAGYNFYFFTPIENENTYEILNKLNFSLGYYITENILMNSHYEYWNIESRLGKNRKNSFWNRIVLEIRCYL